MSEDAAPRRGPVAVVTDSTATLPAELTGWLAAQPVDLRPALQTVPLVLVIGEEEREEPDVTAAALVSALQERVRVVTAAPAPRAFQRAYATLAAAGAPAVVSVHLPLPMSSTLSAASTAARDAPTPVEVVDAGVLGLPLGWAVQAAVESASVLADARTVAAAARRVAAESRLWFLVPHLEHLRRGGRLGVGQALVGTALAVKPVLHVAHGRVELLERVRTTTRARERLVERAAAHAALLRGRGRRLRVGVQHLDAAEDAERLAERVREELPGVPLEIREIGAVIGAHTGPGVVGIGVGGLPG